MRIEDLKRWHWCIVGCLVGAVVASISLATLPREVPGTQTVGPLVFERTLRDKVDPSGGGRRGGLVVDIQNVRIHPPSTIPVPGERAVETEYISYEVLIRDPEHPKQGKWQPRQMILELRTPHDKSLVGNLDGMRMRDYLDKVNAAIAKLDKAKFPKAATVAYKFNWIETPRGAYPAFTLGGLVVVGLVWPTVVQLLVGAGFGRERTAEEKGFDLARYKAKNTATAKAKPGVTQDQMDQLDQLEAELEAKLRAEEIGAPADAPQPAPAAAPVIPVLSTGPMEAPKETAEQARQRKGYGADQGDFYPTEVHGKKS
jgi:hypothetical protein